MDLMAHHLYYGQLRYEDHFNWLTKAEVLIKKAGDIFDDYPGGAEGFMHDFINYLNNPRRFTYTPLILCKGMKR